MIIGSTSHNKVITLAAGASTVVEFKNTTGTPIKCNRVELSVSDAGGAGFAIFIPSGVLSLTGVNIALSATAATGSGTYGYSFDTRETHYLFLGHGKRCVGGTLINYSAAAKTFIISYGVALVSPIVDKGYDPGI